MEDITSYSNLFTSTHFWLVLAGLVAVFLAGLAFRLRTKLESSSAQLKTADSTNDKLSTENARLSERLSAKEQEFDSQAQTHVTRISELQTELDETRTQRDTARQKTGDLETEISALKSRLQVIETLTTERDQARTQLDSLRTEHGELKESFATLKTRMEEETRAAQEKIALLEKAEQRLSEQFENLANRIFDSKTEKFSKESKEGIETLLNPVREQLKGFQQKVEDVYVKESEGRASLFNEIKNLKALNKRISSDALNLTNALKGESKTLGNWGELQLERLLEDSGLRKGHEYDVQESYKNDEGRRLQPDVVIHLPESKDVVVDSKVSLAAYDRYHATDDETEREQQIRQHITSVRTHIKQLSDKNYDELIGVNSLDLVLMFVHVEPALLLALEYDSNLLQYALDRKILLVGPTTLLGTLQIIYNIWRYEYQNRNALVIARHAGALHDQFVLFVESLDDVGKHLDKAQESYTTARKRLTDGRGNLVGRTVKLEKLGAKAKKALPAAMVEEAAENDTEADDLETDVPQLTQNNEQESENA